MDIRVLKPADAKAYFTLRLEALQDTPEAFASSYEEEKDTPLEVYRSRFQSDNPISITFGAFDQQKLIGVVSLVRESKLKLHHKANIFAMYITPEKRGFGLSRILLGEAIKMAKTWRGLEQINLAVVSTNDAAKKLYASMGFEVFGHEKRALKVGPNYYDEDHMALHLWK